MSAQRDSSSGMQVLLGLAAVVGGLLWLIDRVGGTSKLVSFLGRWWPIGIIAFGLINLMRSIQRPWALVGPMLAISVGASLLLLTLGMGYDHLDRFGQRIYGLLWPGVLLVGGVWLLLATVRWGRPDVAHLNEVSRFTWLRAESLTSCAGRFRCASLIVLFGDIRLDLRRAQLDPHGAAINVTALFGSVDILIRGDQQVAIRRPFVFGSRRRESPCVKGSCDGPTLTIHVLGLFGDALAKPTAEPH